MISCLNRWLFFSVREEGCKRFLSVREEGCKRIPAYGLAAGLCGPSQNKAAALTDRNVTY